MPFETLDKEVKTNTLEIRVFMNPELHDFYDAHYNRTKNEL